MSVPEISPEISEDELHALVDGHLDAARAAALGRSLADDPEVARRAETYRAQNRGLHRAFDGVLAEPVPLRMDPAAIRAGRRRAALGRAAAAAVLLLVGVSAGWLLRGGEPPAAVVGFADGALAAHRTFVSEVRHPVEVAAAQEAHLVRWLSKRLGRPIKAPSLVPLGYRLMGGRLLPAGDTPAAQFMYEDASGRRLTLYVHTDARDRDTAFRFVTKRGLSAFYWIDGGLGYALIGELDRATLHKVAETVYRDLSR